MISSRRVNYPIIPPGARNFLFSFLFSMGFHHGIADMGLVDILAKQRCPILEISPNFLTK